MISGELYEVSNFAFKITEIFIDSGLIEIDLVRDWILLLGKITLVKPI